MRLITSCLLFALLHGSSNATMKLKGDNESTLAPPTATPLPPPPDPIAQIESNARIQRESRSVFNFFGFFPHTNWCGNGDIAKNYNDLGKFKEVDSCCRTHDHCPFHVLKGKIKKFYLNQNKMTVNLCSCDEAFFDCLKGMKHRLASSIVGWMFFDVRKNPCVKIENGTHCKLNHWKRKGWSKQERCTATEWGEAAIEYDYMTKAFGKYDSVNEIPAHEKVPVIVA